MATAKHPTNSTKPVRIALNLIKADHALQPRVEMDDEHWNRMARAYVEGDDVPPPIHLFFDGKFYWLADGFHRYKAMWSLRHMGAKFTHIKAFIHDGTKEEAIVFAAQANLNNRSKPMSDADRKKAMWMLMDLPEWQGKAVGVFTKALGLNSKMSKKFWVEYFSLKGLSVPTHGEDSVGRRIPVSKRSTRNRTRPVISANSKGDLFTFIDGKQFYIGRDSGSAETKLEAILTTHEQTQRLYESCGSVANYLAESLIHSSDIYAGCSSRTYTGAFARSVNGIAVTWESFRNRDSAPAAYARACHARFKAGAIRAVVLCPAGAGPAELIEDFRKMGVEWMTIEEFVVSLKANEPGESP